MDMFNITSVRDFNQFLIFKHLDFFSRLTPFTNYWGVQVTELVIEKMKKPISLK